jgi:leishmanolysin-like peptidase
LPRYNFNEKKINNLRVTFRLPFYSLCSTSQFYYSEKTKSISCETSCASQTKCGDYIQIPDEHLDICRYCVNGNDCGEKGIKYPGIDADFILYISSINTEHCNISNTVAFASYCQLESKYNRPVAGYVNICPQSVSAKQSDVHSALATLKHEILHALVSKFSIVKVVYYSIWLSYLI